MSESVPWFEECHCGSNVFKVRVTPYGVCGSDTDWVCAKCGEVIGGIFNDPLNEIPPEVFGRPDEEKVEIPPELVNIETLKMLKALNHPIRLEIVNFILTHKGRET